jgi:hypothetical protein
MPGGQPLRLIALNELNFRFVEHYAAAGELRAMMGPG